MRVLIVLSSSNQMYSGIGRNVFELAKRLTDLIAFEFAIDDATLRNTNLVRDFGREHDIPVHVGRHRRDHDALDAGNADLPNLLEHDRWDAVECVCFANAATNDAVLRHGSDVVLTYTPHDQPTWTVPMSAEQERRTTDVHRRMLRRADLVLCDSPAERENLQRLVPERPNCVHLPLGCDFQLHRPGPIPRREQLVFVGDLVEPRKRFDRVIGVFETLLRERPSLRLVVIGNTSEAAEQRVPSELKHAVSLRGYVSDAELRQTYAESLGLILLSDFEAFGIPILEALASGTPVFLSEQAETWSLFAAFAGAQFCPSDDLTSTSALIGSVIDRGDAAVAATSADRPRLRETFAWDVLAERKWTRLAAAWGRRHAFALSA